jgi:hypothetical protein
VIDNAEDDRSQSRQEFDQAADEAQPGLIREFWDFLRTNKKWWIIPIIVVVLLVAAALVMLGGTALAPFLYPLF